MTAGTSLFGGRGSMLSAPFGALVIGSISNDMDPLALACAIKFMLTGGVLSTAVMIDGVDGRERQRVGRL